MCRRCFRLSKCDYCNKYYIVKHSVKQSKNSFCSRTCQNNEWNINRKYGVRALERFRKEDPERAKEVARRGGVIGGKKQWEGLTEEEKRAKLEKTILSPEAMKKSQQTHWNDRELREAMIQNLKLGIPKEKHCNRCDRTVMHTGNRCWECDPWNFIFDRESFYESKFRGISFQDLDKEICFDHIDELAGVSGIWSIWSITDDASLCLDVAETQDIGNEMRIGIRAIDRGISNIGLSDEEIREIYGYKSSRYIKYRDIASNEGITFKIVSIGISSREEREAIEAAYAHKHRARYWSRAPGQVIHNGI